MRRRGVAMTGRVTLGLMLCALALGCSAQTAAQGSATDAQETTNSAEAAGDSQSIDEQIAILTGRDDADLVPIDGAQAWLGGDGLEAYVDQNTHDEFIVDLTREIVLAYDQGTHIYQDPIDLALYPGEPSREEMIEVADAWAREYLPQRDISTMRRTAWRRVCGGGDEGDMLEYQVMYRRYVNGIGVPEYASVSVTLPSWTWNPSPSAHQGVSAYEPPPPPEVTMLEALEIATEAAGFAELGIKECALKVWDDKYFWSFELENLNVPENSLGGEAAWIYIDALTGECQDVAFSG